MKKQKKCYIYTRVSTAIQVDGYTRKQKEDWNSQLLSVRQEKISADNDCWIRNIVFNFPMPVKGKEIRTLTLESQSTVECVVSITKGKH